MPNRRSLLLAGAGRVERSAASRAVDAGIDAEDTAGLAVTGNRVADCGNGGILVHRKRPGEDRTLVSGNRIERIAATFGGTGQHGNGINVFRADNVLVSGNHLSDCAFSAIRSNAGGNVQTAARVDCRTGRAGKRRGSGALDLRWPATGRAFRQALSRISSGSRST